MPELPEVEVVRRKLLPQLTGRTIRRIVTTEPSYFFLTSPGTLKRRLRGQTVSGLVRSGKYLSLEFESGNTLLLHLGMTGQLFMSGASSLRLLQSTARAASRPSEIACIASDWSGRKLSYPQYPSITSMNRDFTCSIPPSLNHQFAQDTL